MGGGAWVGTGLGPGAGMSSGVERSGTSMQDEPLNGWPLAEAQQGLWFAQSIDPKSPAWNTGQVVELRGPLDIDRFIRAHEQAVAEAQALSFRIASDDQGAGQTSAGVPVQIPGPPPVLSVIDLRGQGGDPAARRRDAMAEITAHAARAVDLAQGPPAWFALYLLADDHALWAEEIHHLVTDGFGMVLFTNRVAAIYNAMGENGAEGAPLTPYAALAQEDAAYRAAPSRADDRAFWADYLAGLGTVASPAGRGAPAGHGFHRARLSLPAETCAGLMARAKAAGVGWPDALTTLTAAYLARVSMGEDLVIGLPFMARMGTKAARVPGMWMNVLPWRLSLDEDADLDDTLRQAAAEMAGLRKHGRYRAEQMRRDLGRAGAGGAVYGPLINVQPFDMPPQFAGLCAELHILGAGAVDDLNITFRGDGRRALMVEVDTNPALYSEDQTRAHAERLVDFLARAVAGADQEADRRIERLADLATLSPAEADWARHQVNATAHDLPDVTLTELIEQVMAAHPDRIAVEAAEGRLTYAELDRKSHALAEWLQAQGAGPDRVVAVALDRGLALSVALLAVLRAGAAYVPIDPDQPKARRDSLIDTVNAVATLGLDGFDPRDWPDHPAAPLTRGALAPDHLAYVLFTSGSTGAPKGVMIAHRAIVNRLLWMAAHYGFGPDDRILQKTPTTFDVSVWELFLPFLCGARLVYAPPGAHRDPREIARLIRDYQITTVHFVPSMLALFLESPASQGLVLDRVFCSGEALHADLRRAFHHRIRADLHNLYGPTEAAVDVTYWPAPPEDQSDPMPIGFPVWNTQVYVLDARLRMRPVGVTGRLYLGGVQLARGYLGRDDLTAERFITHPVLGRLYDSGDMASLRADGAVLYHGRADHQVKIRGMRVEPGEVESLIRARPDVRDALVVAQGQGAGTRLVAYVLADEVGIEAILADLAQVLPAHMVPAAGIVMRDWPLTVSGKLDRKALPPVAMGTDEGAPPKGEVETALAALYMETLALDRLPSRHADFFALGGDSLAAVRLCLGIEAELGRDPGLGQIFETPVLADLGRVLSQAGARLGGLGHRLDLGGEVGPPLFLLHPAGGLGWGYRGLARALAPRRVIAIQAPIFTTGTLPASLTELAQSHADVIEAALSGAGGQDVVHLAGWSVGGILAQEIAVILAERGRRIGLVAALDAYPAECWRSEPEPDEAAALRALLAIAGHDPEAHPELDSRDRVVGFLKEGGSVLGALPAQVLDHVVRLVTGTNRMIRAHHHRHFDGAFLHIRAGADHAGRDLRADYWAGHVGRLDRFEVPLLHAEMTSPKAVALIAPQLQAAMQAAEGPL